MRRMRRNSIDRSGPSRARRRLSRSQLPREQDQQIRALINYFIEKPDHNLADYNRAWRIIQRKLVDNRYRYFFSSRSLSRHLYDFFVIGQKLNDPELSKKVALIQRLSSRPSSRYNSLMFRLRQVVASPRKGDPDDPGPNIDNGQVASNGE